MAQLASGAPDDLRDDNAVRRALPDILARWIWRRSLLEEEALKRSCTVAWRASVLRGEAGQGPRLHGDSDTLMLAVVALWRTATLASKAATSATCSTASSDSIGDRPTAQVALSADAHSQRCKRLVVTHGTILHQHKIGFQLRMLWNRWRQACAEISRERRNFALEAQLQEMDRQLEVERKHREMMTAEVMGSQARYTEFDMILQAESTKRAAATKRCEELERSAAELSSSLEVEKQERQAAFEEVAQLREQLRAATAQARSERERLEQQLQAERLQRQSLSQELRHRDRDALVAQALGEGPPEEACPAARGLSTERRKSAQAISSAVADARAGWARCRELEAQVAEQRSGREAALDRCAELESILEGETREHKAVIAEALAGQVQLQELSRRVEAEARGREEADRALSEERRRRQAAIARCEDLDRLLAEERGRSAELAAQERRVRSEHEDVRRQLEAEKLASGGAVERALRAGRPWHQERRRSLVRRGLSPGSPPSASSPAAKVQAQAGSTPGTLGAALRRFPRSPTSQSQVDDFDISVPLCSSGGGHSASCREDSVQQKLDCSVALSARSEPVSESPSFGGDMNFAQSPGGEPHGVPGVSLHGGAPVASGASSSHESVHVPSKSHLLV